MTPGSFDMLSVHFTGTCALRVVNIILSGKEKVVVVVVVVVTSSV